MDFVLAFGGPLRRLRVIRSNHRALKAGSASVRAFPDAKRTAVVASTSQASDGAHRAAKRFDEQ
jgi:hypothetical protein